MAIQQTTLQLNDADISAIGALTGTSGLLRKTGTNTWTLDLGGGGLAVTTIKTSAYTAAVNDLVRVDSTAGAFTVLLPAAPADGNSVGILDVANKCGTNPVLVGANGLHVESDGTGLSIDINGAYVVLIYNSTGTNWKVAETPTAPTTAFAEGGNASSNYVYGQSINGGTA